LDALTTHHLAQICRIFMDLAYPGGAATIPANKLPFFEILPGRPLADFVPPAKLASGICQEMPRKNGVLHGYEFRLGSTAYSHIKLRVQRVDRQEHDVWVYSVDTHDGFLQATKYLTPKEADDWRLMVEQNRELKHQIEEALTAAGYCTPKHLLQLDLPAAS
jgi:hypothetical protein